MSQVIRIPRNVFKRLESYAIGFDTPAGVITRLLDFYEANRTQEEALMETHVSNASSPTSFMEKYNPLSSISSTRAKTNDTSVQGRFALDLSDEIYTITSPQGVSKNFKLPAVSDKKGIRELTHEVKNFVKKQGGSVGQRNAARKKLTEFGYHITK